MTQLDSHNWRSNNFHKVLKGFSEVVWTHLAQAARQQQFHHLILPPLAGIVYIQELGVLGSTKTAL